MITTYETVETQKATYKCETCGKTSHYKEVILSCEKHHKEEACKHENKTYSVEWNTRDDCLDTYENCSSCGKLLRHGFINDTTINGELAKQLFNKGTIF